MTRGPKIVHVSLQRDAFYLVRLYKKCEIYECMHLFAFSLSRVLAHATIFACYFCKRCSHAVFADSPDPLLHIPITRCVHSLILCVFCFPTVCSLTFHVYHVRYCFRTLCALSLLSFGAYFQSAASVTELHYAHVRFCLNSIDLPSGA